MCVYACKLSDASQDIPTYCFSLIQIKLLSDTRWIFRYNVFIHKHFKNPFIMPMHKTCSSVMTRKRLKYYIIIMILFENVHFLYSGYTL